MYKRFDVDDKPRSFSGVSSIDETLRKVESSGGKVTEPKMAVPGIGWSAFVTDPEGNIQGVFQEDTAAQ
jgi:predicted enzyme related to lactoylglutathione lyase